MGYVGNQQERQDFMPKIKELALVRTTRSLGASLDKLIKEISADRDLISARDLPAKAIRLALLESEPESSETRLEQLINRLHFIALNSSDGTSVKAIELLLAYAGGKPSADDMSSMTRSSEIKLVVSQLALVASSLKGVSGGPQPPHTTDRPPGLDEPQSQATPAAPQNILRSNLPTPSDILDAEIVSETPATPAKGEN